MSPFDQTGFDLRCEWGATGLRHLAPDADAVVIVDTLTFSTCVDVAVARGIAVYPHRWRDATAAERAARLGAVLAGPRDAGGPSLSPGSLAHVPPGALVLPSPNGATLSALAVQAGHAGTRPVLAGCLRNATAVARAARAFGPRVAVIPAGERWDDESLRPAVEDLLGAGAILNALDGTLSPEAGVAVDAFRAARGELLARLAASSSGRELVGRGYAGDVEVAAQLDASAFAPRLVGGAFVAGEA